MKLLRTRGVDFSNAGLAHHLNSEGRTMNKRRFIATSASLAALAVMTSGCTTTSGASGDPEAQRKAIDAGVDSALSRLYQEVGGSQELVASSVGFLAFPSFVSAGFFFGGGTGQGALRKAGKTTGYYRMTEASWGLQAGAQSQAVFVLFMTQDALSRFQASSGWTAGVDGSVTVLTAGANGRVTTQTAQQPIVGFVLTNSGLMGGLTMNGARVTPLNI
jgi:lipid-binding SYLF domain-containing protein